jgi:ASC-1-like (ASCH) protein
MPYLPVDAPPAISVVADNADYRYDRRPDPYPNIRRYNEIQQQLTQQQLNELAPKTASAPEAARRYRELSEQNARQLQILTDPLN